MNKLLFYVYFNFVGIRVDTIYLPFANLSCTGSHCTLLASNVIVLDTTAYHFSSLTMYVGVANPLFAPDSPERSASIDLGFAPRYPASC